MPLAANNREQLKTLYNAPADRVLEPGDPVYLAQVNCQGHKDAIGASAAGIGWRDGGVCLLCRRRLEEGGTAVCQANLSQLLFPTEEGKISRLCLPAVREDVQLPLSPKTVEQAYSAARSEMLPISAKHPAWLEQIGKNYNDCLEKQAHPPLLANFLDNRLVLNYRNGSDWYDAHPLLRNLVDAHVHHTDA